jgi:hypothetical protein
VDRPPDRSSFVCLLSERRGVRNRVRLPPLTLAQVRWPGRSGGRSARSGPVGQLRHGTLKRNLPSIDRNGPLCSKSKGKLKVVWLQAASKSAWAMVPTVRRHDGRIENVVVIEVSVPRKWLRRSKSGLWFCKEDIGPERFKSRIGFDQVSASPIEQPQLKLVG